MRSELGKLAIFFLLLVSCSSPTLKPAGESISAPASPTVTRIPSTATDTPVPTATSTSLESTPTAAAHLNGSGGGVIAFYSSRDGNPEIYVMNSDGSGVARLTDDPGFDDSPAISPDGAQIAFLTSRHDPSPRFPNLKYEIYLMDIDGSDVRRLTSTEAAEGHPAWSPDSSKILRVIETARGAMGQEDIRFLVMNAEQLDFKDESFDTASISASLHHLSDIRRVLEEMERVLKPDGHFIIVEMHREGQTEAELTSVYLHHWVADVDSTLGRLHNSTLARQEFADYVASLGLSNVEFYDFSDRDSNPMEKTRIEQLEGLIERVIQRAEGTSNYGNLKERGEELRQRLYEVGAQREPILVIIGRK